MILIILNNIDYKIINLTPQFVTKLLGSTQSYMVSKTNSMKQPENQTLLSIVIPCYNEQDVIITTIGQLAEFASTQSNLKIEVIAVDDGSIDQTFELLKKLSQNSSFLKIVRLSRNFGHQIALTAGIESSSGDAVILMDADLQDPVEIIQPMIDRWTLGYDVVYGVRRKRKGTPLKSAAAKIFYRMFNLIADVPIPNDTGDFRLMDRKVVDIMRSMPEKDRFLRGMVTWVGFRQTSVEFDREKRKAGTTKYSFRKLRTLGTDGFFSSSYFPLQISTYLGFFLSALSTCVGIKLLVQYFFTKIPFFLGSTILVGIAFIGGIQLISIGIIGSYIARIHNEVRGRPLYVVREQIGFANDVQTSKKRNLTVLTSFESD